MDRSSLEESSRGGRARESGIEQSGARPPCRGSRWGALTAARGVHTAARGSHFPILHKRRKFTRCRCSRSTRRIFSKGGGRIDIKNYVPDRNSSSTITRHSLGGSRVSLVC